MRFVSYVSAVFVSVALVLCASGCASEDEPQHDDTIDPDVAYQNALEAGEITIECNKGDFAGCNCPGQHCQQ